MIQHLCSELHNMRKWRAGSNWISFTIFSNLKMVTSKVDASTRTPTSVPRLKHTAWYMSDHYICLKYFLFWPLIFRLSWLWRNRELVWDIVCGKFAKQLLSVFFLPNGVIRYVYKGRSICSVLVNMRHHEVVKSRVPLLLSTNTLSASLKLTTIIHQRHWLLAWRVTAFPE